MKTKLRLISFIFLAVIFTQLSCGFCKSAPSYIVVYGDSRTNHAVHKEIVKAIMKYKPKIVFHTGDMIDTHRDDWIIFNEITSELRKTAEFYPALGNHEYYGGLNVFADNFELPNNEQWYSVERQGIHFIILNSYTRIDESSEQYAWLESDLKNIGKNIKFTIVFFHHPPFSSQFTPTENWKPLVDAAVPLFEKYGVDIVFNGHVHAYERCLHNNIYYITTGGGGAPLHLSGEKNPYSQKYIATYNFCLLHIEGKRLFVEVLDKDLKPLDEFSITYRSHK